MEIRKVCIVGAGTLGSRIAMQCALSGYRVHVYDVDTKALDRSINLMQKLLGQLIKLKVALPENPEVALASIQFLPHLAEAIADADLVSESVTENLAVKKRVWEELGEVAPSKTLFTTNTSFLLPSQLASSSGRPSLFCALHFHDVFHARLVDIMPHPKTDRSVIPVLEVFGRSLNQVPVVVRKEYPGYLFNTMLMSCIHAAGKLLTRGVAEVEDIDRSWMVNFHMGIGPFGILDQIGLDTAWHVTNNNPDKYTQAFADLLGRYIEQGKLGEKSGEGFYTYPRPRYKDKDFLY
ncbi:3-hydroxyacyl-CoA dehydrogenase NAD-binding domain-containing protein [Lunatimonas salinarum]|uniref:3-hydroxyacyl-CoA dehydrogenase NAD-binding domain-containing protein n=1 Tax=Lunatimonas salinarum TaxID=1774590 RepID=UPI001AE00226|nr:3-hydroxyacyl-CoA dehydrogenase NAD-binding domain-containing protein [Lunatimonas salinarum]